MKISRSGTRVELLAPDDATAQRLADVLTILAPVLARLDPQQALDLGVMAEINRECAPYGLPPEPLAALARRRKERAAAGVSGWVGLQVHETPDPRFPALVKLVVGETIEATFRAAKRTA